MNPSKIVIGIVIVVLVVVGYFFLSRQTTQAPTVNQISIQNFSFSPPVLNIKIGTTVTWVNNDSAPHTVASDNSGSLQSNPLNNGESYSSTFTTAGEFAYYCSIHTSMQGKIIVSAK